MDKLDPNEILKQSLAWDKAQKEIQSEEAQDAISNIAVATAAYYKTLVAQGIPKDTAASLASVFQGQFLTTAILISGQQKPRGG